MTVDAEERFLEAMEDEDDGSEVASLREMAKGMRKRREYRNRRAIDLFLGQGKRTRMVTLVPRYYGELLAWSLAHYIEGEGWQVVSVVGYREPEPVYLDVSIDYGKREELLMNGQQFVGKDGCRLIVTANINLNWQGSVQVEVLAEYKEEAERFAAGVTELMKQQNIYRGKRIEFGMRLRFLSVNGRSWDSITLDSATKAEIRANTVGFLKQGTIWERYGIPEKRGILLAGSPGTGKTIICKALMGEAEGITCITSNAYTMADEDYVTELYELAQDLSPAIVFLEDIDLIGQNREEFGYKTGPALVAMLSVLDGIEEHKAVVTVATTNCLELLDKALSERPSRFDRIIRLGYPSVEDRQGLVSRLCQKITLGPAVQDYLARRTEGCSPAQIQEVIYGLAIERARGTGEGDLLDVTRDEVEKAIAKINGRHKIGMGFSCLGGNGSKARASEGPHETRGE